MNTTPEAYGESAPIGPAQLIQLDKLMAVATGGAEVPIALLDTPVATDHSGLIDAQLESVNTSGDSVTLSNQLCRHGTFIAGVLVGSRNSNTPGICPDCPLLIRPVFNEGDSYAEVQTPALDELAFAITDSLNAGARILNISVGIGRTSLQEHQGLKSALAQINSKGGVAVMASGNQGAMGASTVLTNAAVLPVAACDVTGKPVMYSNLGCSIGRRGVLAPGCGVTGPDSCGTTMTMTGTSAATPLVTGTIALLWSLFPGASASEIKYAVTIGEGRRRTAVVPPLLNALTALHALRALRIK